MKQFSARLIGSLCVAAGSLVAALPAQAILATGVRCTQSTATTSNLGYLGCRGPTDNPVFDGTPIGDPGNLQQLFGARELAGSYQDPFVFKGYSEDPRTGAAILGGPFLNDPHSGTGTLSFRNRLVGVFVVALEGERFLTGSNRGLGSNFSLYLFDANALGSTVNTTGLAYDTLGLSNSTGSGRSTSLAFAGLYVEAGGQTNAPIPEPAGLALLATAFGALALTTRRRGG